MKANEIRLSNWFIGYDYKPFKWEIEHFANLATVYPDEIIKSPIPLTEEILIKAGFKEEYDGWVFGKTIFITKDDDGWHVGNFGFFINSIQYLHQLQNLYFALTGEEIKIEL